MASIRTRRTYAATYAGANAAAEFGVDLVDVATYTAARSGGPLVDLADVGLDDEYSSHHPSIDAAKAAAERDAAGRQWTYSQAADALGVSVRTLYTYARDGRFPAPDGQVGATPWWSPATVCDWQESRPGQGVGGGRPRRSED